jgi:PAS domain S-box-containing protein
MGAAIRVLHVDDNPEFVDVTEEFLSREDDRIDVTAAAAASEALDRLATEEFECVVSDYDMAGRNGLEFLRAVRAEHPDIPFILFTGKGSEEIASEAISAGVSDYIQKGGADRYAMLANRIVTLVDIYRSRRAVEETRNRFRLLVEESTDVILVVGTDATISYATPSAETVLGRTPAELEDTSGFEPIHPEDQPEVVELFGELVENPDARRSVEFRYERPDGTYIWAEARGRNLLEEPAIEGIVVYTHDITERKRRERELERQNQRLEEFTGVVSHDLRNPLTVAQSQLELARADDDPDRLAAVASSLDRCQALVDNLLELAREGDDLGNIETVSLAAVAEQCWQHVGPTGATLSVATERTIRADRSRLTQLLENVMGNALDHGGSEVTVTVGDLDDGFYVADDGPGIPPEEREAVLAPGYSTADGGTGFGLSIAKQIVEAHGWELSVTDSPSGGAQFEVRGVAVAEE